MMLTALFFFSLFFACKLLLIAFFSFIYLFLFFADGDGLHVCLLTKMVIVDA